MRSITATLKTAQKARVRTPFLKAIVQDRFAGIRRLRWTSWYTGSEADKGHASLAWADGGTRYLLRTRFDGTTIYRSRVTDPTSDSTFSSWTTWSLPIITPKADLIAFAKAGSTLWAFVVNNATPTQVYASTSTDNGGTWSSWTLQFTISVSINHIAAAGKSDGDVVVIVTSDVSPPSHINAWKYTGSWTDKGISSTDLDFTGLAILHAGDYNIIATGTDSDGSHVVQHIFGDGFFVAVDTWAAKVAIQDAITASNIGFHSPYLYQPDTLRLTFRQAHTSAVTYDRLYQSRQPSLATFADNLWREPVPFDLLAPFGAAVSSDNTNVYLTTAKRVYSAPITPDTMDITADVISADLHEDPFSPRLSEIVLNNANGAYTTPGSGSAIALTKGADVRVSPGYRTPAGNETSLSQQWYIEGFRHTYEKGRATLTLILGTAWTHLARHRFPRAVTFAEGDKNIFNQLAYVLSRVGSYEFSSPGGSPEISDLSPPLIIPPGTSALTAVTRILSHVADTLMTRGEIIFITEPLAADAADATYKRPLADGDQEIHESIYGDHLKQANHLQIFAEDDASIIADDPDFTETDLLYSAPRQRHDPFLDTGAEATARADAEQRNQTIHTTRGDRIVAPVHCGLETNDIIAITDDRHGLTAAKRRVLSLNLRYDRARPRYNHIIELGAP